MKIEVRSDEGGSRRLEVLKLEVMKLEEVTK